MKKLLIVFVLISSLFLLSGCSSKESKKVPHTSKEIKEIAKKNKLNIDELDDEAEAIAYRAEVTTKNNNYIKFLIIKDETTAVNAFNYYSKLYKNNNDGSGKEINDETTYELSTSEYYYYIKRDKNVLLMTECSISDKKDVTETIKLFNY